ncbi:MAG: prefoldin subunit [Candidatus ainarchaeum sp.]|nr:prefoldin subunit [Candidatus ainarchaeum sp.]
MDEQEKRELMIDFERNRQMLGNVSAQKQQYQIQVEVIKASLEELKETKEKIVMKIIGNILINKTVSEMKKELEEQKESFELRLKTLGRQEETIVKKLNSIKAQIEGKTESKESGETKKSKK